MKSIGLTMRVDIFESLDERRDSIDQRWLPFIEACGFNPVLLPNHESSFGLLQVLRGVVFTGGNTLVSLGGDAPERDKIEVQILEFSLKSHIPILGVCRGMQMIQKYWGLRLQRIPGHIEHRHKIQFKNQRLEVNSYHHFGVIENNTNFDVLAFSDDGVIEAMRHRDLPIQGIMWHPERESDFTEFDLELFRRHFS